jgi:hypothetical protein
VLLVGSNKIKIGKKDIALKLGKNSLTNIQEVDQKWVELDLYS